MSERRSVPQVTEWYEYRDRRIPAGDDLDLSDSETMSVAFYQTDIGGHGEEWVVSNDEALIVTRGALTVRSAEVSRTARAGEVIFLTRGTKVAYEAAEDDTEVVYVTYPRWMEDHGTRLHDQYRSVRDTFRDPLPH